MTVKPGQVRRGKTGELTVGAPCPVYPGFFFCKFGHLGLFYDEADVAARFPDVLYAGHCPYPPRAALESRAREAGKPLSVCAYAA